ncbi:zinc finger, CCHC-type containing protein [Tanacetum coccineum]
MLEPVKVKCIFLGYRKGVVGNKALKVRVQCRCCKELSLRWNRTRDKEQHSAHELLKYREDSNEAAFAVAAVEKIYAHESLTFNDTVACEVIFKWKDGLKDDMDARSDVYVLSNGCRKCNDDSDGYYGSIHQILATMGLLDKAKGNVLGMEIVRDQSGNTLRVSQSRFYNGKLVQTLLEGHFILSLEGRYGLMILGCARSLKANLQHMEALSTTEAGYMMFIEAWKKIWLKGLLAQSGYELSLLAGIATGALVKGGSRSEVQAQVREFSVNLALIIAILGLLGFPTGQAHPPPYLYKKRVDIGTSDYFALDVLLNCLTVLSSESMESGTMIEVNRLSNFPDDVIYKILLYVDILYCIRLSVLSSRWRFIRSSMPNLNFSSNELSKKYPSGYHDFVNDVLSTRNNKIDVSSGSLDLPLPNNELSVLRILEYAFSHNLQQLSISSGRYIELSPSELSSSYFPKLSLDGGFPSLEKVDLDISYPQKTNVHRIFQRLHSVKSLALSLEIFELLSTSEQVISHQPSPFPSLKSLKIYPSSKGLKTLCSRELKNYRLKTSLEIFRTQPDEKQEAMKIKLSAQVTNYLLGTSLNATFTMISHEEARAIKVTTVAYRLMAALQEILEET